MKSLLHISSKLWGVNVQNTVRKTIKFQLRTPIGPENIPLSPVYRFLIILLHRRFFEDYTPLEELVQGRHFRIKIKFSIEEADLLEEYFWWAIH